MSRKRPTVMSFLQRPKRHDQKDMRFFKDIATLLHVMPAAATIETKKVPTTWWKLFQYSRTDV
jgi:hypothetical protein